MMKTLIQLSADGTKAHWKWLWDEKHPLSQMFMPEIVALMVDITGIKPEPAEGWTYDGKAFSASPEINEPPTAPARVIVYTKDLTTKKVVWLNGLHTGLVFEDVS